MSTLTNTATKTTAILASSGQTRERMEREAEEENNKTQKTPKNRSTKPPLQRFFEQTSLSEVESPNNTLSKESKEKIKDRISSDLKRDPELRETQKKIAHLNRDISELQENLKSRKKVLGRSPEKIDSSFRRVLEGYPEKSFLPTPDTLKEAWSKPEELQAILIELKSMEPPWTERLSNAISSFRKPSEPPAKTISVSQNPTVVKLVGLLTEKVNSFRYENRVKTLVTASWKLGEKQAERSRFQETYDARKKAIQPGIMKRHLDLIGSDAEFRDYQNRLVETGTFTEAKINEAKGRVEKSKDYRSLLEELSKAKTKFDSLQSEAWKYDRDELYYTAPDGTRDLKRSMDDLNESFDELLLSKDSLNSSLLERMEIPRVWSKTDRFDRFINLATENPSEYGQHSFKIETSEDVVAIWKGGEQLGELAEFLAKLSENDYRSIPREVEDGYKILSNLVKTRENSGDYHNKNAKFKDLVKHREVAREELHDARVTCFNEMRKLLDKELGITD